MQKSRYGNLEIIDNCWCATFRETIGFVKARDVITNEIKIYVGTAGNCNSEWEDIEFIIDNGAKITPSKLENFVKGENK